MKTLKEINGNYPSIDSTSIMSKEDMNRVLGGDDCKSCGSGCKSGCHDSNRDGKATLQTDISTQLVQSTPPVLDILNTSVVERLY